MIELFGPYIQRVAIHNEKQTGMFILRDMHGRVQRIGGKLN
jgi:hypothetical protein